jgi:hypothetical protein
MEYNASTEVNAMNPKLSRLVLAVAPWLLVAGCVALPADRPAATRASTDVAPVAVSLPTPTPPARGEVTPTIPAPPRAPELRPDPAPRRPHPSSTRTGIDEVDRVIGAALDADPDSLRALVRWLITPCTTREGLGGPPKCDPGEPEGTPVEVFPIGGPEGTFVRRAGIDRLRTSVTGLYAVYRVRADAYREDYWPAGEYGVVFLRPDNSFLVALVGADGIVRVDYPAVSPTDDLSAWTGGDWVLPPAVSWPCCASCWPRAAVNSSRKEEVAHPRGMTPPQAAVCVGQPPRKTGIPLGEPDPPRAAGRVDVEILHRAPTPGPRYPSAP